MFVYFGAILLVEIVYTEEVYKKKKKITHITIKPIQFSFYWKFQNSKVKWYVVTDFCWDRDGSRSKRSEYYHVQTVNFLDFRTPSRTHLSL